MKEEEEEEELEVEGPYGFTHKESGRIIFDAFLFRQRRGKAITLTVTLEGDAMMTTEINHPPRELSQEESSLLFLWVGKLQKAALEKAALDAHIKRLVEGNGE